MTHSIANFRGSAATPGVYMLLTRVNRGDELFFSLSQTGHRKAGHSGSPLNSISYQLNSDLHSYPMKTAILSRGWRVEVCAFHMWTIGRIDLHPHSAGLSFDDCCITALILASMIRKHLVAQGLEAVGHEKHITVTPSDEPLIGISHILFEEYLRHIVPGLLENMDSRLPDPHQQNN
jgi:hypothetical protein